MALSLTGTSGTLVGAIERRFVRERMVALRVEEISSASGGASEETSRGRPARGEPWTFVYLASCSRVLDENGRELVPAEGASTWFAVDSGWTLLQVGRRLSVEHDRTLELPAPRAVKDEVRTSKLVLALNATSLRLLPAKTRAPS